MPATQIVVLKMQGAEFGLPIGLVEEIIRTPAVTPLPNSPSFLKGVINLRNRVLPVLDLREKLGMVQDEQKDSFTVIVTIEGQSVGMMVDQVVEVLKLEEEEIDRDLSGLGREAAALSGIAKLEGRLVLLLQVSEILSSEEIFQLGLLEEMRKKRQEDRALDSSDGNQAAES